MSIYLINVSATGSSYFQPLSWNLRMKVALGAAKGLAYLHGPEAKVIYRDFKSSNVLIDSVCKALFTIAFQSSLRQYTIKQVQFSY